MRVPYGSTKIIKTPSARIKTQQTATTTYQRMSKQDPKNASEGFLQMHPMRFYFGGESGIPVPGKPELFPNSGEAGGNTNEPCPGAVGDSGMPESDVGKADCVGDISGFIPACIQKGLTTSEVNIDILLTIFVLCSIILQGRTWLLCLNSFPSANLNTYRYPFHYRVLTHQAVCRD